jgi:hypothetical protein
VGCFVDAGVVRGGCGDDVVELHDYVGADGVLEGDGVFGGKEPGIGVSREAGWGDGRRLWTYMGDLS